MINPHIQPAVNHDQLVRQLRSMVENAPFISDFAKEILIRDANNYPISFLEALIQRLERGYAATREIITSYQTTTAEVYYEHRANTERLNRLHATKPRPTAEVLRDLEQSLDALPPTHE